MQNKNDEKMKMEDAKQQPIKTQKAVGSDFECCKCCRLCPFPGLKCVIDQNTWERIK